MNKNIFNVLAEFDDDESEKSDNDSLFSNTSDKPTNEWRTMEHKKFDTDRMQRRYVKPSYKTQYRREQKKENHKKMLCTNMTINGKCDYGTKCLYAHSLSEQNVEPARKKVLDILVMDDLSHIDLAVERDVYRNLSILTKMCDDCYRRKCTGGYNCKYGSCEPKILVCYDDLNYGNCTNPSCNYIHLTERGLKPYYNHARTSNKQNLHRNSFPAGTLLTEEFFSRLIKTDVHGDELDDVFSDKSSESEDLECERSIFVDKITSLLGD